MEITECLFNKIGEQVDWPFLNPPHSFISCIILHRYVKEHMKCVLMHKIWKISFNLKSFLQFPDEVKPQEKEGNMLQAFLDSKQQAGHHTPDDRKLLCIWSQLPLKWNPVSPPWHTAKGGSASENILLKHTSYTCHHVLNHHIFKRLNCAAEKFLKRLHIVQCAAAPVAAVTAQATQLSSIPRAAASK